MGEQLFFGDFDLQIMHYVYVCTTIPFASKKFLLVSAPSGKDCFSYDRGQSESMLDATSNLLGVSAGDFSFTSKIYDRGMAACTRTSYSRRRVYSVLLLDPIYAPFGLFCPSRGRRPPSCSTKAERCNATPAFVRTLDPALAPHVERGRQDFVT